MGDAVSVNRITFYCVGRFDCCSSRDLFDFVRVVVTLETNGVPTVRLARGSGASTVPCSVERRDVARLRRGRGIDAGIADPRTGIMATMRRVRTICKTPGWNGIEIRAPVFAGTCISGGIVMSRMHHRSVGQLGPSRSHRIPDDMTVSGAGELLSTRGR